MPTIRCTISSPTEVTCFRTAGSCRYVNRGRVNNTGWVNDQDYRKDDTTPLLAVVGDSFIEAQMVPYAETMQARLAKALEGTVPRLQFRRLGSAAQPVPDLGTPCGADYGARAVVINVVINDFDESHTAYRTAPGFWLYAPDERGELQLRLTPHRRGILWTLAQKSALARYS